MDMETFLKNVGKNIMQTRKARGFTQYEAANLAKISYRYFQKIESGAANVTIGTLYRLVNLFNKPIDELLCSEARHGQ